MLLCNWCCRLVVNSERVCKGWCKLWLVVVRKWFFVLLVCFVVFFCLVSLRVVVCMCFFRLLWLVVS